MWTFIYFLCGLSYASTYSITITKLGYKQETTETAIINVFLWPIPLTSEATKFLINNNYKPVKK